LRDRLVAGDDHIATVMEQYCIKLASLRLLSARMMSTYEGAAVAASSLRGFPV
jgi:hypothetical protein